MSTNYDQIAGEYRKSDDHPVKKHAEAFTFLQVLGPLQHKTVLDLACGYGYYTRLIKQQGAAQVVGVDISEHMIRHAKAIEDRAPLGIEYQIQDATRLDGTTQFDVITAISLFPYASTRKILTTMCQNIYDKLKPGGRLVSITLNHDLSNDDLTGYESYGIVLNATPPLKDGATVTFHVDFHDATFQMVNHYWSKATYERILQKVGFKEIRWHPYRVAETGLKHYGAAYWQPFLRKPYTVMVECRK